MEWRERNVHESLKEIEERIRMILEDIKMERKRNTNCDEYRTKIVRTGQLRYMENVH